MGAARTVTVAVAVFFVACEPSTAERPPVVAAMDDAPPITISDGGLTVEMPASAMACVVYPASSFDPARCPAGAKALQSPPVLADGAFLALASLPDAPGAVGWSVMRQRSSLASAFTPATADAFVRGYLQSARQENAAVGVSDVSVTIVPVHGLSVLRFSMNRDGSAASELEHVVRYVALARGWMYSVSFSSHRAQAAALDHLAGRVASTIQLKDPAPSAPPDPEPPSPTRAPMATAADAGAGGSVAISDADLVIASLRPKFKACYQVGLNRDPTLSGKSTIVARIAPDGSVDSATAQTPSTLSAPVDACLARVIRNAHFATPGGTGSTLKIPITFVIGGDDGDAGTSHP